MLTSLTTSTVHGYSNQRPVAVAIRTSVRRTQYDRLSQQQLCFLSGFQLIWGAASQCQPFHSGQTVNYR